jgi:mRNA interferase HicA
MKRRELIRHLEKNGCEFFREGGNHTIYVNRWAGKTSSIPRHNEIADFLARKICKDLDISFLK